MKMNKFLKREKRKFDRFDVELIIVSVMFILMMVGIVYKGCIVGF